MKNVWNNQHNTYSEENTTDLLQIQKQYHVS